MLPIVIGLLVGPLLLLLLWRQWRGKRHCTYQGFGDGGRVRPPPPVPGLPLLGNVLSMREGAAFVQQCHEKYGDCFTVRLLGQQLTFLFTAPSMHYYFTAPDSEITFGPAVQQFTHRIFGLPPKHFFGKHYVMLSTLRESLAPAGLRRYGDALLGLSERELSSWPESGEVELYGAMQSLVFSAAVSTLFGPAFLVAHGAGLLQRAFFEFEAAFELAASPVPHLLLPGFRQARAQLLAALRTSYKAGHFGGTVADDLVQACGLPPQFIPNMLLAMLWASQANSVPATFWSLAFLLLPENRGVQQRLLAQLGVTAEGQQQQQQPPQQQPQQQQQQQAQRGQHDHCREGAQQQQRAGPEGLREPPSVVLAAALDRRSLPVRCVIEALRLRAMSIDVRIAAADVAVPLGGAGERVLIRKGSVVALSPYTSHQDPRLFGETPTAYDPDREGMLFGGTHSAHVAVVGVGGLAGLSFGGGKYRCPGRYFAELEVALLLGMLLSRFKFELLGPAPAGAKPGSGSSNISSNSSRRSSEPVNGDAAGAPGGTNKGGAPGDPHGLLPPLDLRRLVGLKVPAGPCWVRFERR